MLRDLQKRTIPLGTRGLPNLPEGVQAYDAAYYVWMVLPQFARIRPYRTSMSSAKLGNIGTVGK